MATFATMAGALKELLELKRKHLIELEEMSYRKGFQPGPDLAFAGVRIVVAEADELFNLICQMAPFEREIRQWLVERQKLDKAVEVAAPRALSS